MTERERRDLRNGLLFVSPWIVGFALFVAYPVLASLYYSFCDYSVLSPPHWIGLANYRDLWHDAVFRTALVNTLVFAGVSIPLNLVASLVLALLLAPDRPGIRVYRTLFYVPVLVPQVAVAAIILWVFNSEHGIINLVLKRVYALLGIQAIPPTWISPDWAMGTLIIMSLWGMGNAIVIYIAGLRGVPQALYEAAMIDGAGPVRRAWHVSLPMLGPLIVFNLVMGLIRAFNTFAIPYFMTSGNKSYNLGHAITFYAPLLKREAMDNLRMGYASAMAWVLFVLILGLTLAVMKLSLRRAYAAYDEGGRA